MNETTSRQQINDLWEAVHEIPALLRRWRPDAEDELLRYLEEYEAKWAEPALKARYLQVRDEAA